jgi:hypothetical protein
MILRGSFSAGSFDALFDLLNAWFDYEIESLDGFGRVGRYGVARFGRGYHRQSHLGWQGAGRKRNRFGSGLRSVA